MNRPYLSRDVPWYPAAIVIGKNDRPWEVAFDEIVTTTKQLAGSMAAPPQTR